MTGTLPEKDRQFIETANSSSHWLFADDGPHMATCQEEDGSYVCILAFLNDFFGMVGVTKAELFAWHVAVHAHTMHVCPRPSQTLASQHVVANLGDVARAG